MKNLILTLFVCVFTAGYVNSQSGNPDKYDHIEPFGLRGAPLSFVEKDRKSGFINRAGNEVIPVKYDNFGVFKSADNRKDLWIQVQVDCKWGLMDTTGKIIIPIEYDNMILFDKKIMKNTHWALVEKDNKFGYIDAYGDIVIPVEYDSPHKIPLKKYKKQYKAGLLKDNPSD